MAIVEEGKEFETCVVFGGRGFIGKPLVDRLLRLGNWIVRIVDSFPTIQLEPSESLLSHTLSSGRASYIHVDVRHKSNIITGQYLCNVYIGSTTCLIVNSMCCLKDKE
ncbi:hypothetical protein AABB24_039948 [Solanum stoloniferum]|uniref:3-beta hydroxysteroid dehydrogenase/isomerase domain-containing protein n=1 Tax=Solanum stoloniferum TaxID=62892 RepID=A0ABD2QST8_9SOLN